MAKKLVCTTCGSYELPKQSFGSSKKFCKKCGGEQLVPADTPVGKKMLDDQQSKTPAENAVTPPKRDTSSDIQMRSLLKWIGIFILFMVGIAFWYIAIPAVIIWYLYKRNKTLTSKTKLITSISVSVFFLIFGALFLYDTRAPELQILSPENHFSIQSTTTPITGIVDPVDAELMINGISVEVDSDGNFVYEARLRSESNTFTIEAKNGSETESSVLRIDRIFTEEEIVEREQKEAEAKIQQEEARVSEAIERLGKELTSFDSAFDASAYRDSVLALQIELVLFSTWADIINQYKNDDNTEIQALSKRLKQKVTALQIKEFPLIRKNYAEVLADLMWESNVDVEALGGSRKTIQLTAGMFANNANKAEAQRTIVETLKMFRFTQANYKWFEYDDEYTYFEIESLSDGDVVVIE